MATVGLGVAARDRGRSRTAWGRRAAPHGAAASRLLELPALGPRHPLLPNAIFHVFSPKMCALSAEHLHDHHLPRNMG